MVTEVLLRLKARLAGPPIIGVVILVLVVLYEIVDFISNVQWVEENMIESGKLSRFFDAVGSHASLVVAVVGLAVVLIAPRKWPWENGSQNLSREEATLKYLDSTNIETTSLRDIFTVLAPRMATGLAPGATPGLLQEHFHISRSDASEDVINNLTLAGLVSEDQRRSNAGSYIRYCLTNYGSDIAQRIRITGH